MPENKRRPIRNGRLFVLNETGSLCCELQGVEVMGRDISVVSSHKASLNANIRSIISTENKIDIQNTMVKFSLMPHKVFLFDKQTEKRIEPKQISPMK